MAVKKVIAFLLILLIAVVGVAAAVGYSYRNSQVTMGESSTTKNISRSGDVANPQFTGTIVVEQVIHIYNSGNLNVQDVVVNVTVFFIGEQNPTELEIGDGINNLGTIESGANETKTISVTIDQHIPRLAIEDGTLRVVFQVSLSLQYIPYSADLPVQETTQPYSAPYGDFTG